MSQDLLLWGGFNLFVILMLALDLGVFHRKAKVIPVREAIAWSLGWIALALLFNWGIYTYRGPEAGIEFFTGYLIEKSLSVDNIFVILMIFSYFRVPPQYQHKVLFWGILGALVMRLLMILMGIALITTFHWVIYLFGAFLIATGLRMAFKEETEIHPENNPLVKLARKRFRFTSDYVEDRFFVRLGGKLFATPLFLALLMVETADLVFAVDSIPAIFAITTDPFIVYTSNVFAILGLRSLYFALAGVVEKFHYLRYGLAAILVFVGIKMVLVDVYKVPVWLALGFIAVALLSSAVASLMFPSPHPKGEFSATLAVEDEEKEP